MTTSSKQGDARLAMAAFNLSISTCSSGWNGCFKALPREHADVAKTAMSLTISIAFLRFLGSVEPCAPKPMPIPLMESMYGLFTPLTVELCAETMLLLSSSESSGIGEDRLPVPLLNSVFN